MRLASYTPFFVFLSALVSAAPVRFFLHSDLGTQRRAKRAIYRQVKEEQV
jgi:hypothetical protein